MLVLQINGKPQQFPPGSNVKYLIATLHLEGKRFAIELNGEIVPKSRHALTHLDTVHQDAGRLQKKTGCCLPVPERSSLPCCAARA